MKIKKVTTTESEVEINLPIFLKKKDDSGFAAIQEKKYYEISLYSYSSPSLYYGNHNEEKIGAILKEYPETITQEQFLAALSKYVKVRKEWNKRYLTNAAEVLKEITEPKKVQEEATV